MDAACRKYHGSAAETVTRYDYLRAYADGAEVGLHGSNGSKALLTHYAFGQIAARVQAPASYLRRLPAPLAAECLNTGLEAKGEDKEARLLFHRNNGDLLLRAVTGEVYERVWNWEVTSRLLNLQDQGWRTAPARPANDSNTRKRLATAEDCGPWTRIQPGETIAPAGLYASDHDMFAFLLHPDRVIDDGSGKPLFRGFFCWNSEVGDKSWGISKFLFESACGNHIIWGTKAVAEFRFAHIGHINERIARTVQVELRKYADDSVSDEEARIKAARQFVIAASKDEVLDKVFRMRIPVLSRKALEASYGAAEKAEYDPKTAWGMVQGITRVSQETAYADQRTELDRAAGKVMQIAF
jgi:hypothetical protein